MKLLVIVLLLGAPALHAEIVDRILATVEDRVITWSEVCAEAEYQAFTEEQDPPACASSGAADAKSPVLQQALSQLTDQVLLEQAMARSPFSPPPQEEPADQLRRLQQRFSGMDTYRRALARYHLSEEAVQQRMIHQQELLAFVDSLLRPQIRIDADAIQRYYEEEFVPELRRRSPVQVPPLEAVQEQIQEILTQQEINRLLEVRLEELRRSAKIKMWPE